MRAQIESGRGCVQKRDGSKQYHFKTRELGSTHIGRKQQKT